MFSATRAATRVAWRNVVRHRMRSFLVSLLILLPVAAMVAGIAVLRTMTPTQEEMTTREMGRADLVASFVSEEDLRPYLPAGSHLERLLQAQDRLVLEGARPGVNLRAIQLDGLADGILSLIGGRAPVGADEAAISRSVAELAGVDIGGTIDLDAVGQRTVVGLVENPRFLDERSVVIEPGSAGDLTELATETGTAQWLVDLPDGADADAIVASTYSPDGETQAFGLASRNSGFIRLGEDGSSPTVMVFGALALLEAALIASAAFAVSIRRRQRELGLLAATGATSRQVASTVVVEAILIGLLACAGGVLAGVVIALGISPFLDDLSGYRNGPLVVDLAGVVGPVVIGLVASVIAAFAPARSVARLPVLRALSGRRPAEASARVTLGLGLLAIGASVVMTIVGATVRFEGTSASIFILMGAAVIGTLGFGACAPWLLERLELVAARLPLPARIAFRDTARARSRSAPIVTAILASLAASVAIGAWQATNAASELRYWQPSLYDDQLVLFGSGTDAAGKEMLRLEGVVGGGSAPGLYPADSDRYLSFEFPGARHQDGTLVNLYERCENCGAEFAPPQVNDVAAGSPEALTLAHAEGVAEDLRAGRAVVLSAEPMVATTMEVVAHDNATEQRTVLMTLPVRVLPSRVSGGLLPEAFLPDSAIATLGLAPQGLAGDQPFVVRYDHPVTEADLATARTVASRFGDTYAELGNVPPDRQGEAFRIVLVALVVLFSISVTGIAIALGEAESRPEQRSLLALGADPSLRRRIAAARAAVLALVAGLLAVPAGLLPVWGVFTSRKVDIALPGLEIAAALVVLPLLAIASAWLLSRPIPDWNAFRNVRPGE